MSYEPPANPFNPSGHPSQPYQGQDQPSYQPQEGPPVRPYGKAEYGEDHEYNQNHQTGYHGNDSDLPPPINYATKPEEGQSFEEQFKVEKPKWNDVIFIFVFLAFVAGFIVIAALTLSAYVKHRGFEGTSIYNSQNTFSLNTHTIILFAFVTVICVVLAFLYYTLARVFTKQFIIITMILQIVISVGTAIYLLIEKDWSAGIVGLVFALFSAFCYWTMRSRIPFATIVLKTIIDVTRIVPSTLFISAIGALFSGALSMFFSVVMVATYVKYHDSPDNPSCSNGGCSNGKLIGLLVYITFSAYYMSEVARNVIRVSICGVYGSWYYSYKSDQGMPKWPALGAFKRAMTYSFGSICFGSLVVAVINLIRDLLNLAQQVNADNGGNPIVTLVLCCVQCIVGIINWAVQYFNNFAYTYIALYGKAYIPAAKDTWTIVKARGIDALINDALIGNVLTFGSMFVAYVAALFAYLFLRFTHPAYNSSGGYYPIVVGFAFVIGLQIGNITTVSINSGVHSFFVALAKDPEVFRMSYPDTFEALLQAYPQVRQKLDL
ncbi:Pns1p [Sugiyamaella lignohabitans]|uniref:Protein PNS1 n=1 Tax=Sugiyamaella lignohabitans TaxID=796027 RepID=A0A161HHS6_9ASCO|nr:Pns1p [Sugiyamaella lignohabitans]ANB15630.1 Pns1p [Sugiyamaella lignohabitans]